MSLVAAANTKTTREAGEQLVEPGGRRVLAADRRLGQPRVVDAHRAAERREQAAQRAAEVAEADDPDRAAREQERAGVGLEPLRLAPGAHRAVGGADPAREVDRHPERRLGHRHGERRAGAQHVHAARPRRRVVDVGQEVALDVDHGAQPRRAREPLRRQVGLPDDRDRLGQVRLDLLAPPSARRRRRRAGRAPSSRARVGGSQIIVERARQRVDEDERPPAWPGR